MDDVTESRTWGQEAKQRPRRDDAMSAGLVIIADPTQMALGDAVVRGWQTYVNIVSVQHGVYLQVRGARTNVRRNEMRLKQANTPFTQQSKHEANSEHTSCTCILNTFASCLHPVCFLL